MPTFPKYETYQDTQIYWLQNIPSTWKMERAKWLFSKMERPVRHSGLAWVDEHEPNAQILADLQASLQQAAPGQTFPVSQRWDDEVVYR